MDEKTTVAELRGLVQRFVDERDWNRFHSPKNLAMSAAIEAAELMEHFQWISMDDSRALARNPKKLAHIGEELADVLAYCLALANQLNLDISEILARKMEKNAAKYPAEKYRGRFGLESECPKQCQPVGAGRFAVGKVEVDLATGFGLQVNFGALVGRAVLGADGAHAKCLVRLDEVAARVGEVGVLLHLSFAEPGLHLG